MAMFPLGAVLFPHMPLRLRVFEQRYLVMLAEMLKNDDARFGVVLIERGHEVGGGEHRFGVGTVAEITQLGAQDGFVGLVAQGGERFEVAEWLGDAPHPRADVRPLPPLVWDPAATEARDRTEQLVRRTLALASEFDEQVWSADIELSADPLEACWQLAAIAPVGALDQLKLLRAATVAELLELVGTLTTEAAEGFTAAWPDDPPD